MLIIPAIIESVASRKDKSYTVRIATNELTPEKVGQLSSHLQKYCFVAFQADEFKTEEIEIMENLQADLIDDKKSKSQWIRSILFALWKEVPEGYDQFEPYYDFYMTRIGEWLKTKFPQ